MRINSTKNRYQQGATLLEIMMVLGLIAVITFSALAFYQKTSQSNKMQTEVKNLGALVSGIENMYASQGNYNGLTNTVIYNSNFIPDSMKGVAVGSLMTQWKNPITVTSSGAAFQQMQILLSAIPKAACMEMVSSLYKSFPTTIIGGTTISPTSATAVTSISTACNAAATVNLTFRR